MSNRTFLICVAILATSTCEKTQSADQSSNSTAAAAASAFAKTIFCSRVHCKSIRIMSSTAIELSIGAENIVGLYTREGTRIRAVAENPGRKQSHYFLEIPESLRAERDGLFTAQNPR